MKREEYRAWRAADLELKARLRGLRVDAAPGDPPQAVMTAYRHQYGPRRRQWWKWAAVPIAAAAAVVMGLWLKPPVKVAEPAAREMTERTTEFIPVRYGASVRTNEAVQIVRIRLPRGELMRLGLPVGTEAAGETVRADVLIGEDGLVKAIRFVY